MELFSATQLCVSWSKWCISISERYNTKIEINESYLNFKDLHKFNRYFIRQSVLGTQRPGRSDIRFHEHVSSDELLLADMVSEELQEQDAMGCNPACELAHSQCSSTSIVVPEKERSYIPGQLRVDFAPGLPNIRHSTGPFEILHYPQLGHMCFLYCFTYRLIKIWSTLLSPGKFYLPTYFNCW